MSEEHDPSKPKPKGETPRGDVTGFVRYWKSDVASGFFVFLIALPLCLAIASASGFPPIAGVITAIVGSILTSLVSNSELTIKGPAAGLIVIVAGAVADFTSDGHSPDQAYRMALAVGVAAGVLQVIFGYIRAGVLGDFFPTSAVHGMLAAIGVIIILKQLPVALGETAQGGPLEILRELPDKFVHLNPEIALIGAVSLAILFGLPWLNAKWKKPWLKLIPAQLVVLLVAVPMGLYYDLSHEHTYSFLGHEYELGEQFLVNVPKNLVKAIALPNFSALLTFTAWKWVPMFALIGSLESMLSAKAIDMLDPWKRKTNLNRDLIAVGMANTLTACLGGLPMISEIVRSKANIDNGARTRFADFWHGLFLLLFVALLPTLIHSIPLAALAAMLVYTGFRLASPREFINIYKIGREQLAIFVATIVAVLATDLLIGIGVGIGLKILIHFINGVPLRSVFMPYLEVETVGERTVRINASGSAVFTNWIPFRRQIDQLGLVQNNDIIVDLSGCKLVDHSVMEKLHEVEMDFEQAGLRFEVVGLDSHQQLSEHPHSARRRSMHRLRRVTIVTNAELEETIVGKLADLGASGYTVLPCAGAGRRALTEGAAKRESLVRLEAVMPNETAEVLLNYVHSSLSPSHPVTACLETVDVLRRDQF